MRVIVGDLRVIWKARIARANAKLRLAFGYLRVIVVIVF
jgi:hypothetical protein